MGDMTDAFVRQLAEYNKSQYIDRTGWTRQQWIDDADELMSHTDGAITSLVNGHVTALLSGLDKARKDLRELQEVVDAQDRLATDLQPINIIFDGPSGPVTGRFIEVELVEGSGVKVGEWLRLSSHRGVVWVLQSTEEPINIIFDGPPGAVSGRFIEVEDDQGHGLGVGEWVELPGRQWALRITELPRKKE